MKFTGLKKVIAALTLALLVAPFFPVSSASAAVDPAPVGGALVIKTVMHPLGIEVAAPIDGVYQITPALSMDGLDVFQSLSVVVTDNNLDLEAVPVYVDDNLNGEMVFDGTVWNYANQASVPVFDTGYHNLRATFTDASDNETTLTARFLTDNTAPVITLTDANPLNVEFGSAYTDPGATWTDAVDGSGAAVIGGDTVDTSVLGATYVVTYDKTDAAGNPATQVPRTVNIVKRNLVVTADTLEKYYGEADPGLTYTITTGSLLSGDTLGGTLERELGEDVDTYAITVGTLVLDSENAANYNYSFVGSELTINKAKIVVTADSVFKVAGAVDPELTYTYEGSLMIGDNFTGTLSRVAGEEVGTYAIKQGTLTLSDNYEIAFVDGLLSITAAPQLTNDAAPKVLVLAAMSGDDSSVEVKGDVKEKGEIKVATTDSNSDEKQSKSIPAFGIAILLLLLLFGLYLIYQQKPEWFAWMMFWKKK